MAFRVSKVLRGLTVSQTDGQTVYDQCAKHYKHVLIMLQCRATEEEDVTQVQCAGPQCIRSCLVSQVACPQPLHVQNVPLG